MKNEILAICIPTYNRADILFEDLELMSEEILKYSIPVYISDDSPDDHTEKRISEFREKYNYDYVYYFHNVPALGHDKNCIRTLSLADTEYVWYLNDSIIIKRSGIETVLGYINRHRPDFISVNVKGRDTGVRSQTFTAGNPLLVAIGWYLTQTGATIYSRKSLEGIHDMDLTLCPNFPQTDIILRQFDLRKQKLMWVEDEIIYGNPSKQSYWNLKVFQVFLSDWTFFIMHLPDSYTPENKRLTIRKHSDKSRLFGLPKFVGYRMKGIFDFRTLLKFYQLIKDNSSVSIVFLIALSLTPKFLLKALFRIYSIFFEKPQ